MIGLKATLVSVLSLFLVSHRAPRRLVDDFPHTRIAATDALSQRCIDNTGASLLECVTVPKMRYSGYGAARAGDLIVVVVKKARPTNEGNAPSGGLAQKVRKGDVRHAVVVRTKKETRRPDGRYIRFDDNAAVLINAKKEMLGSRITGIVAKEVRDVCRRIRPL